jgi:hypothetical protein
MGWIDETWAEVIKDGIVRMGGDRVEVWSSGILDADDD